MEHGAFLREAIRCTGSIFRQTERWDSFSKKTLGEQIFRAAVSVASNVAEGHNRGERQERQFLGIALGSCNEVIVQLGICSSCGLIAQSTARDLVTRYKELRTWLESRIALFDECAPEYNTDSEDKNGNVPF